MVTRCEKLQVISKALCINRAKVQDMRAKAKCQRVAFM